MTYTKYCHYVLYSIFFYAILQRHMVHFPSFSRAQIYKYTTGHNSGKAYWPRWLFLSCMFSYKNYKFIGFWFLKGRGSKGDLFPWQSFSFYVNHSREMKKGLQKWDFSQAITWLESYHSPDSFCWNSQLDSRLEKAVRQLVWGRHETGIFYPARQPFAGGCEAVVLYTVRWLSLGGRVTAIYQIGTRQAFNTMRDSHLQAAVRRMFFFPWDSCLESAVRCMFPDQMVNPSRRYVALRTIHTM